MTQLPLQLLRRCSALDYCLLVQGKARIPQKPTAVPSVMGGQSVHWPRRCRASPPGLSLTLLSPHQSPSRRNTMLANLYPGQLDLYLPLVLQLLPLILGSYSFKTCDFGRYFIIFSDPQDYILFLNPPDDIIFFLALQIPIFFCQPTRFPYFFLSLLPYILFYFLIPPEYLFFSSRQMFISRSVFNAYSLPVFLSPFSSSLVCHNKLFLFRF